MSEPRARREEEVLPGRRPVLELLRSGSSAQKILISDRSHASNVAAEIRRRAETLDIPVRTVPVQELDRLAAGMNHQGVVALTTSFRYVALDRLLTTSGSTIIFLDGVMDPHNLGSLLRSADGAGFGGVVIPTHRSAAVTATVRRVSAGAAEVVPVARVSSLGAALQQARRTGMWIVGLDHDAEETLWMSTALEPPIGLVLGAEDRGISKGARSHCDAFVRIPSSGRLDSLNVAVAGAIAMFEVARRREASATL